MAKTATHITVDGERYDLQDAELAQDVSDLKALSGDVSELKSKVQSSSYRYNWYDPNEPHKFVASNLVADRTQTEVNSDGSWTSVAANGAHGQVLFKSLDENKILSAGTYTLSARITLNEGYTGADIRGYCRIGSSSNTICYMKTERGGDINITGGTKVGWVKFTATLEQDYPFVFGIEVANQASSSLPYTVDYIQLNAGGAVSDYSTDTWRVSDKTAQAAAETAQAAAETVVIFGDNSRVTIDNGKQTLTFFKSLMIFTPTGRINLSPEQIASMLGSAAVYDTDTGSITITVTTNNSLVYDFSDKTVQIVPTANHEPDQLVLFAQYYGNPAGYLWTKFHVDRVADGYYMQAPLANIILTSTGRFDVDAAAKTIAFSGSMYIDSCGKRTTISASSVVEAIPDYAVYDDTNGKVTITLPTNKILVYSFETSGLRIKSSSAKDDIILFSEYYGNDYGLICDKYWRDKWIDESANNLLTAVKVFNSEPYTGDYDWQTPVASYGALFNNKQNVESFAFFTDPHTLGFSDGNRNELKMENSFKRVQKVYNSTPCSFMVCGGDWLNNSTTKEEACYRLGYLKGISKNMFKDFHLVLGNHDTNYQGKADAESAANTGRLTNETIAAIMFRDTDTKKAYYSFDGSNSKCYILDTGIEHNSMLPYDWEQIGWLAEQLKTDDPEHAIIFMHIIVSSGTIQTNASNFGAVVEAFNAHTTVTLNNETYDFTDCSGHVDFWVAGHTHKDSEGTLGGIPYFITATNAYTSDVPLIDLALVDYDSNTVDLVRVGGTGDDRSFRF